MKTTSKGIMAAVLAVASIGQLQAKGPENGGKSKGDHRADGHGRDDSPGRSLDVVGLTRDQRLLRFDEYSPDRAKSSMPISGLTGSDTALVGIDYRVQDGKLYGVGNAGGIYTVNPKTGVAVYVNSLSVALSGTSFGVDFNPVADRLRVISDTGQNLRHNVNAGGITLADSTLNYTLGSPAQSISGAAYTNNDLDATTSTTLYDIDTALDQVVLQSPPNAGSLAATGKLTVDTSLETGFDIYSTLRDGVTVDVEALASLSSPTGTASLYSVHLPTGKVTWRGTFKPSDLVMDIAIPLDQF
ncbi:MAG: DUF4394 domain-containing protein [Verrucomicrobiota bacterium]